MIAICTTAEAAKAIQSDDDQKAHLPWPGVYLDGSPCPPDQGRTLHLYDVTQHPKDAKWAYPVSDTAVTEAKPGDPIKAATIVDKLDSTWDAKVASEEAIEK